MRGDEIRLDFHGSVRRHEWTPKAVTSSAEHEQIKAAVFKEVKRIGPTAVRNIVLTLNFPTNAIYAALTSLMREEKLTRSGAKRLYVYEVTK